LLELLVGARPGVVSKRQIIDRLWPDCVVSDGSIAGLVCEIRSVLGDEGDAIVRTVHGVGYAFAAETTEEQRSVPGLGAALRGFLLIEPGPGARCIDLFDGEVVIGRGLECDVRVSSMTVSRAHARLRVGREAAILEDLCSRNGTYLRGVKVSEPVRLADGDAVRLGQVEMVFRVAAPPEGETEPAR
jgi:FHA domain-containing protein